MQTILSDADVNKVPEIDYIIVLGKPPGWNQEPDIILESRLNLAIKLLSLYPKAKIVCSGGRSFTNTEKFHGSEAVLMRNYLLKNGVSTENILIEEQSVSGINQLIIIKKKYVLTEKPEAIALISDEFHIPWVSIVFDAINGDACEVYYLGSRINISDKYREIIQSHFDLRDENGREYISLSKRGDHEAFEKREIGYRELMRLRIARGGSRLQMIDPREVLEFMKTGTDPKLAVK